MRHPGDRKEALGAAMPSSRGCRKQPGGSMRGRARLGHACWEISLRSPNAGTLTENIAWNRFITADLTYRRDKCPVTAG